MNPEEATKTAFTPKELMQNKIRKRLDILKKQRLSEEPYSELKTIAWNATKQALEWVLEETEILLAF